MGNVGGFRAMATTVVDVFAELKNILDGADAAMLIKMLREGDGAYVLEINAGHIVSYQKVSRKVKVATVIEELTERAGRESQGPTAVPID